MAVRRILAVLALTGLTSAQNPWVNRRKNKDKDAPVAADPSSGDTDFSKLNDMVKNLQQAGAAGGAGGEDMFAGMGDMWESLMDSPEMEEMLANPELLKATIKNNPLINAIPGASEQVVWEFDNGYGASLSNLGTHIELAVVRVDDRGRWRLCYTTPITNDVMRIDSREMLATLLTKILALDSVKWDFENER